jgi:hypothetical protein
MTFEEWFKIVTKQDFDTMLRETIDLVAWDHELGCDAKHNLKEWISNIYNVGWNDGRGSKGTRDILSSFISDVKEQA